MRITYPCGCTQSSRCPDHARPRDVSAPIALVALTLFVGMLTVWAAILG